MKFETLRAARKASIYTVRELAEVARISQTSYIFKETGRVKMSLKEGLKIAGLLRIPAEDLFPEIFQEVENP